MFYLGGGMVSWCCAWVCLLFLSIYELGLGDLSYVSSLIEVSFSIVEGILPVLCSVCTLYRPRKYFAG